MDTVNRLKSWLSVVLSWNPGGQLAYAQEGEDLILSRIFESQDDGFYVDVRAFHPTRYSNTYWAYRRGWRGLAIDAAPGFRWRYSQRRPGDLAVEVAVTETYGSHELHVFDEPALNTLKVERAEQLIAEGTSTGRAISVLGMPIADILTSFVPAGTRIDLMSIDIEGSEAVVLRGIDWEQFKPRVLVVEVLDTVLESLKDWSEHDYLVSQGFVPTAFLYHSVIYITDPELLTRHWNFRGRE